MRRSTFVRLSLLAFGLLLVSFVIRGFSQFLVSSSTAAWLSAPTMLVAGALVVVLTVQSVLAVAGVRPLEE